MEEVFHHRGSVFKDGGAGVDVLILWLWHSELLVAVSASFGSIRIGEGVEKF